MVALPKTILQEVGRTIYPRKTATQKEIKTRFAIHGYGQAKFTKWLQYFIDNEILTVNEDGSFSCSLWVW